MAFTTHGDETYKFGFNDAGAAAIAAAIGLKPQTLSMSYEPEFTAEAQDENGETVAVVVGERKINFTLSGYVTDATALKAADSFEYDSRYFIIEGVKLDESNKEFVRGEVTGVSYKNITAPTP